MHMNDERQNQAQSNQAQPNQPQPDQDALSLDPAERRRAGEQEERNESGLPGGGVGRKDIPGHTGVYPVSADEGASPDAPIQGEESWGQGARGPAGYQDSGGSEVIPPNQLGKTDEESI
jgi:hypothetical protein